MEMNTELSTAILKEVAMQSPKEWADQIYTRNKTALDVVQMWHAQIVINPRVELQANANIRHGCPHCIASMKCRACIWNKVMNTVAPELAYHESNKSSFYNVPAHRPCCVVLFNEVAHIDVCQQAILNLCYSGTSAYVFVDYHPGVSESEAKSHYHRYIQEYDNVVNFLQGHMEWSKWDCWGKLGYKETN